MKRFICLHCGTRYFSLIEVIRCAFWCSVRRLRPYPQVESVDYSLRRN